MYLSPEVFKQEKPYSIKADVFSIGQLLTEVLLQRHLEGTEWIDLKSQSLFQIIPELYFSQNSNKSKFAYEILSNMFILIKHQDQNQQHCIRRFSNLQQMKIPQNLYKKSFEKAHLKTIFGIENVIQAITIISKYKNIVSLYLDIDKLKVSDFDINQEGQIDQLINLKRKEIKKYSSRKKLFQKKKVITMNNSTPFDYKDNYSIQSFPNSQSDKSKASYDKPHSENKIEAEGIKDSQQKNQFQKLNFTQPKFFFNNQNFSQGINSQFIHESIQSSGQQSIKSNHNKSQPSCDKFEINSICFLQNQSQQLFNNQNLSQGVNSQIILENDQFSVQQSKKSNQDKSQTSYDNFNNQIKVTEIGNKESFNKLNQQQINSLQFQQQFTNQHIINQGISSQSQSSHQNEYDFPQNEINEAEIVSINPEGKPQKNYQSCQLIQDLTKNEQFQLKKEQIKEKLRKKFYELLDCCIQTGDKQSFQLNIEFCRAYKNYHSGINDPRGN
ncbi:hypothetical protein ABPG72_017720 [Tetrahymena utriculariae]